jgi:hypothetical protein
MATTTPNFGWPVPTSSDLVKNGATAIEGLGDAIDASLLDLKGGTTGQVLAKASNTDMDFSWVAQDDANAIQNTQLTAKGALISAVSAGTPATLTVGTNDQVLTADSTTATGLKWATASASSPASAQNFVSTAQSTTSTTYAALGTAQAVTLTTGTKVLVLLSMSATSDNNTNNPRSFMSVAVSGATTIAASDANSVMSRCVQANVLNGRVGVSLFLTCTAGSNTFTAQFRQPDYTGTFSDRQMIVIDLGS